MITLSENKIFRCTFWPVFKLNHPKEINKVQSFFFLLLLFSGITYCTFYLYNDLWQDEIYTLDNFVLVPLSQTISDYHSTNNHIIFNLFANFYLQVLHINRIETLLNNPYIIRLLPFSFSLFGLLIFYLSFKKLYGSLYAILTTSIYLSSIQFYTFACQVRGYSMDLLFVIILLNSIFLYKKNQEIKYLSFIIVSGTLLLINLPSTIYFFLTLILLIFYAFLKSIYKWDWKQIMQLYLFMLLLSLILSLVLFLVFYYFKIQQLKQNVLFLNAGNSISNLIRQPISVYYRLFDWRILLLIASILVLYFNSKKTFFSVSFFLIGLITIPFLFYSIHNPVIILRIWIILLPVICILITQFCLPLLNYKIWFFPFIILLIFFTSIINMVVFKRQSLELNKVSHASLDLKYQYHLFNFNANSIKEKARQMAKKHEAEIVLYDHSQSGINYYFKNDHILTNNTLDNATKKVILISDKTNIFNDPLLKNYHVIDSGKENLSQFFKWYYLERKITIK